MQRIKLACLLVYAGFILVCFNSFLFLFYIPRVHRAFSLLFFEMAHHVMSVVFLIDIAGAYFGSSCPHGSLGHQFSSRSSDSSPSSLLSSGCSHRIFVFICITLEFIPTYRHLALAFFVILSSCPGDLLRGRFNIDRGSCFTFVFTLQTAYSPSFVGAYSRTFTHQTVHSLFMLGSTATFCFSHVDSVKRS